MATTTTKPKNPATPKQLAYIKTLMHKVYGQNADEAFLVFIEREPDVKTASAKIDSFRSFLDSKTETPKVSTPTGTVPNGIHMIDGFIIRIRTSKSGNQYAERLLTQIEREEAKKQTGEDTMWLYEGRKGMKGASAATLLTLEQAKAYGKAYGVCAKCGALLSDPDSVEAGIGPVCATKF